jgi:hypothetical protein
MQQPVLQALWEDQQKYGAVTDDTTASLLQQAEEQGIVGEKQKDVQNKILDVLMSIATVFGATLPDSVQTFADKAKDSFNSVKLNAQDAKSDIAAQFATMPDIKLNFDYGAPPDVVPMAAGGEGTVDRPTLFLAGEAGRERYKFSGANRDFSGGESGGRVAGYAGPSAREIAEELAGVFEARQAISATLIASRVRDELGVGGR